MIIQMESLIDDIVDKDISQYEKDASKVLKTKNRKNIKELIKRGDDILKKGSKSSFSKIHQIRVNRIKTKLENKLSKLPPELTDDDKKKIRTELQKIVKKYNADPNVRKRAESAINELNKEEPTTNYKYKDFICGRDFDAVGSEGDCVGFEVTTQDQSYKVAMSGIIDSMCKDLKDALNDPSFKYDTGDGDEGCIYVEKKRVSDN